MNSSKVNHNTLLSDVAYHDYAMLMVYTDAEWSRRRMSKEKFPDSVRENAKIFDGVCKEYRNEICENFKQYTNANQKALGANDELASYLYSPLSYVPFGHADDFSFVLIDDLHPIQHLTADIPRTIEDIVLALCPKADTIKSKDADSLVVDMHELIPSETDITRIQEDTPLLTFSRYKMEGLAVLGQGLQCQHAIMCAMAKRMEQTKKALLHSLQTQTSPSSKIITAEDVMTTKVVFLDLQGVEEIGTFIFSRNYSVAMTLVTAVRSLTFADMFEAQPQFRDLFDKKRTHRAFLHVADQVRTGSSEIKHRDSHFLDDNHVFGWSDTTLAVVPQLLLKEEKNCTGYVSAFGAIQYSPGHLGAAQEAIKTARKKCKEDNATPKISEGEFQFCTLNTSDMLVSYAETDIIEQIPLLSLGAVLSRMATMRETFGSKKESDDKGRTISDFMTRLLIPIPARFSDRDPRNGFICGALEKRHFSTSEVLHEVQHHLFYDEGGELCWEELQKHLVRHRIPSSLRTSISCLYQNAAVLFADPYTCDLMLDVYDSLRAFYFLLEKWPVSSTNDGANKPPFSEDELEQIAAFVDAINSAISHRISHGYATSKNRDMAIDFRGALNHLIVAADVPVKCGIGLFRKYSKGNVPEEEEMKVGALAHVSFAPGATCHEILYATNLPVKLAYFKVDASHFLHVSSYVDYLHETFHLIWGDDQSRRAPLAIYKGCHAVTLERIDEVFVSLMCLLFVFDGDAKTFMRHLVCGYTSSLASLGDDDVDTVVRFCEFMFRAFLVAQPFLVSPRNAITIVEQKCKWRENDYGATNEQRRQEFIDFIEEYSCFFSEYARLWCDGRITAITDYCRDQFDELWANTSKCMGDVWDKAINVYEKYAANALPRIKIEENGTHRELFNDIERIREQIRTGFNEGRAIIRNRYEKPRNSDDKVPGSTSSGLDSLWLVCETMREYIRQRQDIWDTTKAIHLKRDHQTGEVCYRQNANDKFKGWNKWQLDRGLGCYFSPDPDARRERLRMHIVILKTMWDISTNLRARRLTRILISHWPELKAEFQKTPRAVY